jgi:hypothetical protein
LAAAGALGAFFFEVEPFLAGVLGGAACAPWSATVAVFSVVLACTSFMVF